MQVSISALPKVISGFPGVGKSSVFRKFPEGRIADSDSSTFDKAYFPQNYIEHIVNMVPKKDYVMVSSHDNVRVALGQAQIPYALVYPDRSLKAEYLQRYTDRGSPESFVKMMDANWDKFIDSCEAQTDCQHIKLMQGQFLADVLT